MSQMDNNQQVDERTWQAWIQKNAAQGKVRFARRVKVIELGLCNCAQLEPLLKRKLLNQKKA